MAVKGLGAAQDNYFSGASWQVPAARCDLLATGWVQFVRMPFAFLGDFLMVAAAYFSELDDS